MNDTILWGTSRVLACVDGEEEREKGEGKRDEGEKELLQRLG